jgi:hypothetical protein
VTSPAGAGQAVSLWLKNLKNINHYYFYHGDTENTE